MTDNMVTCIRCDKRLESIIPTDKGFQPVDGIAFHTRGHYGTAVFDPMDGSYLEITVCDECVQSAIERGITFLGPPDQEFSWSKMGLSDEEYVVLDAILTEQPLEKEQSK